MFSVVMKKLALLAVIVVLLQLTAAIPARAQSEDEVRVKQLNFVFLHGAGGNPCSMQLLSDTILENIEPYIAAYEAANPGIDIQVDVMNRCYPNDVDMRTWANNIADSVGRHFSGKRNIILVGHSAGGKAALYAVANNVSGITDKVAMVVTINSPIKAMGGYYATGGTSVADFCRVRWLAGDAGICDSVANYDSSDDGAWVAQNKHWLAFISGESAPSSAQFGFGGVDGWPRDMDDGIVPMSAQYSDAADVVYYGEHGHGDFEVSEAISENLAEQILTYIFGGTIYCSHFVREGAFEHKANWFLGTDYWDEVKGGVLVDSGRLENANGSFFFWEDWKEVVGDCPEGSLRSNFTVEAVDPFLFFTSVVESRWFQADDPDDCRLYIHSRSAPRNTVKVDWKIYRQGTLPDGLERDHYEVEIITGTPLTSIPYVSWLNDDPSDVRIRVVSEAESPFRWFEAEWRLYAKQPRERQIIEELMLDPLAS
ncbi:MAG: alpha/beta hydrolase [Dehalococcoidia bacterium]|jgi:pimeloyl-ACP methyl ester carboxylesterase